MEVAGSLRLQLGECWRDLLSISVKGQCNRTRAPRVKPKSLEVQERPHHILPTLTGAGETDAYYEASKQKVMFLSVVPPCKCWKLFASICGIAFLNPVPSPVQNRPKFLELSLLHCARETA